MIARLLASAVLLAIVACTAAAPSATVCTPNKDVFCRCQDRREGQMTCKEDGSGYGRCEPCESFDNPVVSGGDFPPNGEDEPDEVDASASAICGNGVVEPGEDCDVKKAKPEDGCDTSCKLSGTTPFATNACPGLAVHVWGGDHQPTFEGTTTSSGKRSASVACGAKATTGSVAPDRVFKVTPHATGTLKVRVSDPEFNAFLYATASCGPDEQETLACANDADGAGGETLSVAVTKDIPVHVFVDGTGSPNNGAFKVTFAIEN